MHTIENTTLRQDESYKVIDEKNRHLGSVTLYGVRSWHACARDATGNIYGLEEAKSREDAVQKVLDWHNTFKTWENWK